MKKLILSIALLWGASVVMCAVGGMFDLTEVYLKNADFSQDVHNKTTRGTDFFGDDGTYDPVDGWDIEKYGWGVAATYSYGIGYTLHNKVLPTSDPDGNTDGATLGIVSAWGGWAKYSQAVTLPAGDYYVVYNVYNANSGVNTINYTGFVAEGGVEYLSSVSTFANNIWTRDTVRFTLNETTQGKIQLGFGSTDSGSADKAAPFIDGVKIFGTTKNTFLSSFSIAEEGLLFPDFAPGITNYDFYGASDLEAITISAAALDAKNAVSITGDGTVAIVDGKATAQITVTASQGEATVYTINVSLEEKALIDVTKAYLINADFTADVHNKTTSGDDFFGDDGTYDPVDGWEIEKNGWGVAATYSYGTNYTLHNKVVPASDPEGNTEGATLGIINAWGGWVKYSQAVTLPAGIYEIYYDAHNSNTGTSTINFTGFVTDGGTETFSSLNNFPSMQWTNDTIRFMLAKETSGKIQLGLGSTNSNSADKAGLFFDGIKLYSSVDDIEVYRSVLNEMMTNAQSLYDAGGFYAPLGEDLQAAIQAANTAQNSSELADVLAAIEGIKVSLDEMQPSLSDYVNLASYIADMDLAVNTYQRTDLAAYLDTLQNAYDNQSWDADKINAEIARKSSLYYDIELEPANEKVFKVKQRIDVDWVETSFPSRFDQEIVGDNHFISYYDNNKNFCVGYRKLNETSFHKVILNSKVGWDSHNYIEMIVDNEGYIHLSGNMHNVQLNYWRSKRPYDASEFFTLHSMVDSLEDNTTYPHFIMTNDGDLLFHYRYGWSGNGYEVYNIWDPKAKSWSRFLDEPLIDGEGLRNAYMNGPYYEKDGYYHLYWVWRETPDAATNHTFSYARSKDLKNWESAAGESVASPIVFGEDKLKVDVSTIDHGTGTLNNLPKHVLDSKNRIILCNMKYDALGNSQLYAYRLKDDNTWEEKCITNWLYRFNFGGGGSLIFEINLYGMDYLGDGEIAVNYYHSQYGDGTIILDEETLEPIAVREKERTYPEDLDVVNTEGTYASAIQSRVNIAGNYILRWESMQDNNDRMPEGTLPPANMMVMLELEGDTSTTALMPAKDLEGSTLKVSQKKSSLYVSGLTIGDSVDVINTRGVVIWHGEANHNECYLPLPEEGIYLIASGDEVCKVMVKDF